MLYKESAYLVINIRRPVLLCAAKHLHRIYQISAGYAVL